MRSNRRLKFHCELEYCELMRIVWGEWDYASGKPLKHSLFRIFLPLDHWVP